MHLKCTIFNAICAPVNRLRGVRVTRNLWMDGSSLRGAHWQLFMVIFTHFKNSLYSCCRLNGVCNISAGTHAHLALSLRCIFCQLPPLVATLVWAFPLVCEWGKKLQQLHWTTTVAHYSVSLWHFGKKDSAPHATFSVWISPLSTFMVFIIDVL